MYLQKGDVIWKHSGALEVWSTSALCLPPVDFQWCPSQLLCLQLGLSSPPAQSFKSFLSKHR